MEQNIVIWNKIRRLINNDKLVDFLESNNPNTIYVSGGCIRSILLEENSIIKDIDIFVNLPKQDFELFINNIKEWGSLEYGQYGSPRLFCHNQSYYFDIVPFFNFVVSYKKITNINDLLSNFDFTANAIAIDIVTKRLYNPQNGIQDIKQRILRAVRTDFPEKNISKKIPLSAVSSFWFRLLHYQKKLNFEFAPETREWIMKNRTRYRDLSLFKQYFFSPMIDPKLLSDILHHE